jgi:hypothetical protein
LQQEEIINCIEPSFISFCQTFRKQPADASFEIQLFIDELGQNAEYLRKLTAEPEADYTAWFHALHGIKSILAVFGFEPVVEEANRLMLLLKNKPELVQKKSVDDICRATDDIIAYFKSRK